jgi:hypothetical protein
VDNDRLAQRNEDVLGVGLIVKVRWDSQSFVDLTVADVPNASAYLADEQKLPITQQRPAIRCTITIFGVTCPVAERIVQIDIH